MNTLYNISNEHKALMAQIEAAEGEITEDIAASLEIVEEQLQEKAVGYAYIIKHYDDTADIIDKEIKRLQALKKKADNNADRLKQRIKEAMIQFGVSKVETETITLSFRKSVAVEINNENEVPSAYMKFAAPTPDKTAIKKALESGEIVTGARLQENQNLQIK